MNYDFDTLKRFQELSGLEHCLLSYLTCSLNLLALDNNDCNDVIISHLRSLARNICDELHITAYL